MDSTTELDHAWWKESVFYQIYPRSFNDSDGDGIGDLPGITERVAYLDDLGVDAVWLSPVYDSPQRDNGYDIRDYRAIDDDYGDMADWERLRSSLHDHDIRLVMDLVVNHTSEEHEWFQRSRRREGKYEDYYIWRAGDPDEPPNNWESIFGGPAWSYDDVRGEWYLHLFAENQPDLNWRNPDVRESILDVARWWLERGVDGFRMDAITYLSKRAGLPDGDPEKPLVGSEHYAHGPRIEEYVALLCDVCEAYDAVTIAEMGHTSIEQAAAYTDADGPGIDLSFQFDHVHPGYDPANVFDPELPTEWELTAFKRIVAEQQRTIPWNTLFFGNHDLPRAVSRIGDERYRRESATLLATCLLTMRGTPFVYQGEELGMSNADFGSLAEVDDPMVVGQIEAMVEDGTLAEPADGMDIVNAWSRDHSRTPMQWSGEAQAGFTDGEPWLTVTDDYREINVAADRADERSVWHYYRRLIERRHEEDVLVYGEFDLLLPEDEQLFVYLRTLGSDRILVALNFSSETIERSLPDSAGFDPESASLLECNYGETEDENDRGASGTGLALRPWEARVYQL
ncbi:MAG: glycoside hydrolase family 13 protein [Halovenus sp.]